MVDKSTVHGNDAMMVQKFISFSFSRMHNVLRNLMKVDIKNCECYCKNCSEQFSIVYTLIHHGNGVKMFQTLQ